MSDLDYYQILGVNPTATDKSIRTRYKILAQTYDPDRLAGNITEAYEVLIDKDLRTFYNNHGKSKKDVQTYKVNKHIR